MAEQKRSKSQVVSVSDDSCLSRHYLDRHSGKSELIRKLHVIVDALSDDELDVDSSAATDLPELVEALADEKYLCHREKDVRLLCVLACMEIFSIYAPSPPWSEDKILQIFSQVVRQLANLAVCTSPSQPNFLHYLRLLERLATVKIGVVLVELTRSLEPKDSMSPTNKSPTSDDALEVLCELVRTILISVSIDHPPEVASNGVSAICACIDEFDSGIPISLLDEILGCISMGPVVFVTNPAFVEASAAVAQAKKKGKQVEAIKLPPTQIQQTNHSYMVAAAVIRKTEDRISTSIAYLLNGLLTLDSNILKRTNISSADALVQASTENVTASSQQYADVWTIIYELHRISAPILTTVIGTVATLLQSSNSQIRLRVTKLLGRLFNSSSSNIAVQFHSCFREWVRLSTDTDQNIRSCIAKNLISILSNKNGEKQLCKEATDALVDMVMKDSCVDVRLLIVREVCDLVYRQKGSETLNNDPHHTQDSHETRQLQSSSGTSMALVSSRLLKAVGNRVSSKNKTERRDAVTGLAQIYFRRYALEKLKKVTSGGDDCDIETIIETVADACKIKCDRDKRKVVHRTNELSSDREYFDLDEKYGFIPRLVFESACFTDSMDPEMRSRVIQIVDEMLLGPYPSEGETNASSLTATSRAIGLVMILHSFLSSEKMEVKSIEESNAYKWLCSLQIQRAKLQQAVCVYIETRSKAREAVRGSDDASTLQSAAMSKLDVIVKMCTTNSSTSSNSPSSIDQSVPKLFHEAKDKHIFRLLATIATPTHSTAARARALDELPKRAKSLGLPVASWLKDLARRCAMGGLINVEVMSHCIQLAQEAFEVREFPVVMLFLTAIRFVVNIFPSIISAKDCFGDLARFFGSCIDTNSIEIKKKIQEHGLITILSGILASAASSRPLKVNASPDSDDVGVDTGLRSQLVKLCTRSGSAEQARLAVHTLAAMYKDELGEYSKNSHGEDNVFVIILKSVTSPSSMVISINGKDNEKIVTVLTALSALVEIAPSLFFRKDKSRRAEAAIKFAFDTVILGHDDDLSVNERNNKGQGSSASDHHGSQLSPESIVSSKVMKSRSNEELSLPCRRLCAAMDFITSHIRSTIRYKKTTASSFDSSSTLFPSKDHIASVFTVLISVINESGLPPTLRDRGACKGVKELAALRKCAALNILRLCDRSLGLDDEFLSFRMWCILSSIFTDIDADVRAAVLDELSAMLLCSGVYNGAFSPSLRFLAFVVLSSESTILAASGSIKLRNISKSTVERCINSLRKNCESISLQCRSKSRQAEQYFDTNLKFTLMPEYALPYATYLLSFCKDTPNAGGSGLLASNQGEKSIHADDSYEDAIEEGNFQRLLRKRLKCLLEPLVHSLGDSADNITFLLRMAELLGQKYCPITYSGKTVVDGESTESSLNQSRISSEVDALSFARFKVVCSSTREILMKLVKKDVHLAPYPGAVNIPSALFTRVTRGPSNEAMIEGASKSKSSNRVHFSPDVIDDSKHRTVSRVLDNSFLESDPVEKHMSGSKSPFQNRLLESSVSPIPSSANTPGSDQNSSLHSESSIDVMEQGTLKNKSSPPLTSPTVDLNFQQSFSSTSSDASQALKRQPLTDANARDLKRRKKISPVSVSLDTKNSDESEMVDREDGLKVDSSTDASIEKKNALVELDFTDDDPKPQMKLNRNSSSTKGQSRKKR